jgi:hypothetical protein
MAAAVLVAAGLGPITGCDTDDTRSPSPPPAAPSPPPPAPQTPPKAVHSTTTVPGSSHVFQ